VVLLRTVCAPRRKQGKREGCELMKQWAAGVLYLLTSMMGMLAAAYETHVGMVAAYVLFAGSLLSFFSKSKLRLWLPFIGSSALAFYVVPTELRNLILHPEIFDTLETVTLHILLFLLVVLSFIVSARAIKAFLFDESRTKHPNRSATQP
jgi:hypothetical protein